MDFQQPLERAQEIIDFQFATLLLSDPETNQLRVVAQKGDEANFIDSIHFPLGMGLSAWIAQKKRTIHLPDIHRGTRHSHHPVRSFLAIPIILGNEGIGVLSLGHVHPNAFGEKEIEALTAFLEKMAQRITGSAESDQQED
jgi:GAF domain-containing protein